MIKVENLIINPQNKPILEIKSFGIEKGTKANIIGKNKTGKSSLLKILKGEKIPEYGEIIYNDKNPQYLRILEIEVLPHLVENYSVWQNIVLPLTKITNREEIRIQDFCEIFDLHNSLDKKVKDLSFSEKKFTELIRSVIQLPHLILIDDFDTFFDDMTQLKVSRLLEYAVSGGTAVVAFSKIRQEGFDKYYRIQNKELLEL
jgi:ABC-type cobalamin/Fe3+-siderophores transport system ATPase subunit